MLLINAEFKVVDDPFGLERSLWEQLQYVGDPCLARQAITNIDDSRTPEGITESRYPSDSPQFIPPFLASLG